MSGEWAIKDDKQILIQGDYAYIMHLWNMNTLTDEAFPKYYGNLERDQSLLFKNYFGGLQLIQIICDIPALAKPHKNIFIKD